VKRFLVTNYAPRGNKHPLSPTKPPTPQVDAPFVETCPHAAKTPRRPRTSTPRPDDPPHATRATHGHGKPCGRPGRSSTQPRTLHNDHQSHRNRLPSKMARARTHRSEEQRTNTLSALRNTPELHDNQATELGRTRPHHPIRTRRHQHPGQRPHHLPSMQPTTRRPHHTPPHGHTPALHNHHAPRLVTSPSRHQPRPDRPSARPDRPAEPRTAKNGGICPSPARPAHPERIARYLPDRFSTTPI